jgi:hypothetical protein
MSMDNVLSSIEAEIARLQQARALLAGLVQLPEHRSHLHR